MNRLTLTTRSLTRLNAALMIALAGAVALSVPSHLSAQEPGWVSDVITAPTIRPQLDQVPIVNRPYRPFHVYGNTVRRLYYRGTALPTARDVRQSLRVLRNPNAPRLANYLGR